MSQGRRHEGGDDEDLGTTIEDQPRTPFIVWLFALTSST